MYKNNFAEQRLNLSATKYTKQWQINLTREELLLCDDECVHQVALSSGDTDMSVSVMNDYLIIIIQESRIVPSSAAEYERVHEQKS